MRRIRKILLILPSFAKHAVCTISSGRHPIAQCRSPWPYRVPSCRSNRWNAVLLALFASLLLVNLLACSGGKLTSNSSTGSTSTSTGSSGTGDPVLSGLSCANGSMTGAGTDSCTVMLNAAAGTGGQAVSLSSNATAVTVPSSVTVAAGATSANFTATVSAVSTAQTATLTASSGGATKTYAISLGAAVPTLTLSTGTVSFGDGGSRRDRNRVGDADFVGHGGRDGERRIGERNRFYDFRRELPADLEPWSDGDADGNLRSDGGECGERRSDADQQLVDAARRQPSP